jgi:hypothetical protein
MADNVILLDIADGVATVTLNRPEAMNALSVALRRALARAPQRRPFYPGSDERLEAFRSRNSAFAWIDAILADFGVPLVDDFGKAE